MNEEQLTEFVQELGIEIINPDRRYWLIRAGKEGAFFNEFLRLGFTGIGYAINDLEFLKTATKEQLKDKIATILTDSENQIGQIASKIYNFVHEVKKDDVIIMPSAGREIISFGIIEDSDIYISDQLLLEESIIAANSQVIPDKRRKVKWIKTTKSENVPAKVLLHLFSPHGISLIADKEIIELVDNLISDLFLKNSEAHMTFNVKTEENIDFDSLTDYLSILNNATRFSANYFKEKTKPTVKLNLNSPGPISLEAGIYTVIGTVIFLALLGCDFEISALGCKFKVKSEGLYKYIKLCLEYIKEKEEREYNRNLSKLQIKEPEVINKIREDIEKEEESSDAPIDS
ncbi:hypothetical protein [Fusobacterium vincentii ATCC 49256]|uniref:Uncharacterized protein n=1 Tax=Fusobacterium vincentii ATCC 49256 TaxID=209882 RepID=Q7P889_FUSVC|nr:hypothetical protein [Fusobacterium vincentii ATCC 49256]